MRPTKFFSRHLALVGAPHTDADVTEIYADDATMTLVYAPEGHTRELVGGAAIARFQTRIGEFFTIDARPQPVIREFEGGLVAEYRGEMTSKETERPYHQEYMAVVECAPDGRLRRIREHYDPIRVLVAIGDMD